MTRWLLVWAWLGAAAAWAAVVPAVRVAAPEPNAVVKGAVTFRVALAVPGKLAGVEYLLNGRSLSGLLTVAPYDFPWNSALVYDGRASVVAVARKADGSTLAASAPVPLQIANGGGDLRLLAPNLGKPLAGTVKFTVDASRTPATVEAGRAATDALMFFVDGRQIGQVWGGNRGSAELDTTRLANGAHHLYISAWGFGKGAPPFAQVAATFTVDNGHALRDIRPRWRDLFLAPGQKIDLAPRKLFTDGTEENATAGLTFASSDVKVATVDARGTVTAVAPGVATVITARDALQVATRVIVDPPHGFPHFARDGQVLTAYDPLRSLFVRSLVNLNAPEIAATPGLMAHTKAAAINALTTGFFLNPADGGQTTFDAWRKSWDPWWEKIAREAQVGDFSLVLTGDEIARTANELAFCVGSPWAPQALKHAFTRIRDSKAVACIEMVDEVSTRWGATPAPTDGRWQRRTPPISDDAFIRLMDALCAVEERPPLSWPVGGVANLTAAASWMGDPAFADYASHGWEIMDWRRAYPGGVASLPQLLTSMERVMLGRLPALQRDKPSLFRVDLRGGGAKPGDPLDGADTGAVSASIEPLYAATMGAAGVRADAYDGREWKRARQYAKAGTGALPVGADPFGVGTARWWGMAAAFNLLKTLEPDLLQPSLNAVDVGPNIVTGARQGKAGRLLLAINFNERPETVRVDLTPYRYDKGPAMVRYRLLGAALATETTPNGPADTLTLAPGETVAWVCRPPLSPQGLPPTVRILGPPTGATVAGKVAISVNAADDTRIDRVECTVDGKTVGALVGGPYLFTWDATDAASGAWHGIVVTAYDADNNASQARALVRVAAPVLSAPGGVPVESKE
jgi:hypothetical protein